MKLLIKDQYRYIVFLLLTANIILSIYVRLINVSYDISAIQDTDPVRYIHQAKQIVEMGRMPEIDRFRSAPLGEKTSRQLTLYPYVISGIYKLINTTHFHVELEKLAIILPVIFFVFTVLTVYIMAWRIFDNYTALLSINIMIFIPPLVARTRAGFPDRDCLVLLLSLVSFLFYVLAYLNNSNKRKWLYKFISASTMLLASLTWQGAGIFIAVVVTTEFMRLLTDFSYSFTESKLFAYWVLPISVGLIILKPDVYRYLSQPYAFVAIAYPLFVLSICIMVSIIQYIKGFKRLLSFRGRLPVGITVVFSMIALLIIIHIAGLTHLFSALVKSFIFPFGEPPLFQTIDELQKLGLIGWKQWPGIFLIPIIFGLLLIVHDICKSLNLNQHLVMGSIEIIILGIAFSRLLSGRSTTNFTENSITLTVYWVSTGIGLLGLIFSIIYAYLKRNPDKISPVDSVTLVKIFLVLWSIFMFILLRSAIRFIFLFAIPSSIMGGYAFVWIFKKHIEENKMPLIYLVYIVSILWQIYILCIDKMIWHYLFVLIYILLTVLTIFVIFFGIKYKSKSSLLTKLCITALSLYIISIVSISPSIALGGYASEVRKKFQSGSLIEEKAIQNALEWIRKNTNVNAIIAADWEYGGWINLLGNRATIIDEQQRIRWANLMARKVFMGNDITDALEYLKTHKADYLFLTMRNIKLLSAIAQGADIQWYSGISFFGNIVQETIFNDKDRIINKCHRYCNVDWQPVPGTFDLIIDGKKYTSEQWAIYSIYLQFDGEGERFELVNALAEIILNENETRYIPLQRIYYKEKILCQEGLEQLPGSIVVCVEKDTMNKPENWHIIYLDPKTRNLLPIRLFLFGEMPEIFERVYPPPGTDDPSEYTAQVWKIHYSPGIKERPEYLDMGSLAPTNF